ncbi:MAG: hypothetical protein LBO62_06110 [Endomicrobium sp.]|nr:hypothetical protein [Endomicrobium sp.]
MKNIFTLIFLSVLIGSIVSCGDKNPVKPQSLPPVPKPNTPVETAAFAAKKADYFIRLAFDLADGYLYNNSVAKNRYGTDSNYVNSLNFNRANEGIITSRDLGTFEFWYYKDDKPADGEKEPPQTYDVIITSYALGVSSLDIKRQTVTAIAERELAKRFYITFHGTDIGVGQEHLSFDIWYSSAGQATEKGAEILSNASPMSFIVKDSTGISNTFTASFVSNIKGKIKNARSDYSPSPEYEFIIEEGTLNITGCGYTINLNYSNNKAEGSFTDGGGFSANIHLNKDGKYGAYYIVDGFPDITHYIGWDFP